MISPRGVASLLRRGHQAERTSPAPGTDSVFNDSSFNDEEFEVLERGALWDEAFVAEISPTDGATGRP